MPRYIIRPDAKSPKHGRLVKRLAQELKASGKDLQPLILELEITATGSRHVNVICHR